ncbi:MAG: Hsp70 family protein, partial [Proteobacteria bacterium]|nr:Hsp70 family protein [Pseudomonadota bacterium]
AVVADEGEPRSIGDRAQWHVDGTLDVELVEPAIGETSVAFTFVAGLAGNDLDRAAGGVLTIQRPLRAAQDFDSPEIEGARSVLPYEMVEASNGDAHIKVDDKVYSPPEISAIILQKLKALQVLLKKLLPK